MPEDNDSDQEYKNQVAREEKIREVLADPNTKTESNRVVDALREREGHVSTSTDLLCNVLIKTADQRINGTECYLNGVKVAKMFNVSFEHPVGDLPRVTLSVYPTQLVMQGAAYVEVIAFCPNCRARMDENRESIHAKLTIAKEGNIEGPKISDVNPSGELPGY